MYRPLVALALVALAPAAWAQDDELLEYREFEAEETEKPVTVSGSFETQWHEYHNLDFRPLDESSDQAILDSDDRGGFPFTGASLAVSYDVEPGVRFDFSASHRGQWGGDQIGGTNRFGNMVYITDLHAELSPMPEAENPLLIKVGRQRYKLGGIAGNDYVLDDVLDMILVELPLGTIGSVELIPVNVIQQSDNDGLDFVGYIGQADLPTFNFRGDTMSRRHGLVLRLDEIPGPLDITGYGFYTDVGAGASVPSYGLFSSGVDITYQGLLGNFTDNDWVANFGGRVGLEDVGPLSAWGELAASTGIDRKELVATDVNTDGLAWGGGVQVDTRDDEASDTENTGFKGTASYFDAFGPAYGKDGLMYSHGYVGMKGRHAGGQLFNRFLGFHPTAYIGIFGVSDLPNEPSRKSGTRVLQADAIGDFGKPWVRASWWYLQDTSISDLQLGRLDQVDPPFGYSRDEFAAQARVGEVIGQEINLSAGYQVTEKVEVRALGAGILPGDYYSVVIARVAGDALGFKDPVMPWSAMAGLSVDL